MSLEEFFIIISVRFDFHFLCIFFLLLLVLWLSRFYRWPLVLTMSFEHETFSHSFSFTIFYVSSTWNLFADANDRFISTLLPVESKIKHEVMDSRKTQRMILSLTMWSIADSKANQFMNLSWTRWSVQLTNYMNYDFVSRWQVNKYTNWCVCTLT